MNHFTDEQREAIYTLGCNVAVSAGAGAGKTRVLVERYFNLLDTRKASPKEIVAITFTNKAAKEMKERIRAKVSEKADAALGEEKLYWNQVKHELEYAYICTIDSLCGQIIRDNPVEAGVDPQFHVFDDVENILLIRNTMLEIFYAALESGEEWLDTLLRHYSKRQLLKGTESFYECFEALQYRGLTLEDFLAPYHEFGSQMTPHKEKCLELLAELMGDADQITGKAQKEQVAKMIENWMAIKDAINGYDGSNHKNSAEILKGYVLCLKSTGNKKELISELKETLELLQEGYCNTLAVEILPHIYEFLFRIYTDIQAQKQSRQQFNFSDIVFKTLRLLREYDSVTARYCQKFKQIMVDEFQDTDDTQRQIIYLLAGKDKDRLVGNKLFIVGDAKQSIYRFRGADVSVFVRVIDDVLGSGGKHIKLDTNFRTVKELLDVYNDIFSALMGTEYDDISFERLNYFSSAGKLPCAGVIAINGQDISAAEARFAEAQAITAKIQALIADQKYNYGDFALLFRSTSGIDIYEQALKEADIPYYVVAGKGFFHQQEIIDILNLLMVIDNCYNEIALAGVLRSPFFSLSDDILVLLKAYGKSIWNGFSRVGEIAELTGSERQAVDFAARTLRQLRQLKGRVNLNALLEQIWLTTDYKKYLLTDYLGLQKYANLEKFEYIAAEFDKKDLYTLGDFIRYIQTMMEEAAREGAAQIESESGNTVKLMTVHKAKGLEFPVVVIPDMHRGRNNSDGGLFNFSSECGVGIKVTGEDDDSLLETHLYKAVNASNSRLEGLELKRLLYVAMTRAKEYLLMTYVGEKEDRRKNKSAANFDKDYTELSSWTKWLQKMYRCAYIDDMEDTLQLQDGLIAVEKDFTPLMTAPANTWLEQYQAMRSQKDFCDMTGKIISQTAPLAIDEAYAASISATALAYFRRCPRSYFYKYQNGLPEVFDQGHSLQAPGTVVGTAVHRVCELVLNGIEAEAAVAQALEEVSGETANLVAADVKELAAKFIHSELYRQIAALKTGAEVRFNVKIPLYGSHLEQLSINGSIDCVVFYSDGTVGILDYKTDHVDCDKTKEKASVYHWQLILYTLAAEKITGKEVKDAKLYFLRPDVQIEVGISSNEIQEALIGIAETTGYMVTHQEEGDFKRETANCEYCGYAYCCRKL